MKPGIISAIAESCYKIGRLHRFVLHLGESNIASQKLCAAVEMFIAHERKILAPIPQLTPIIICGKMRGIVAASDASLSLYGC